jgi:hypothetical protein
MRNIIDENRPHPLALRRNDSDVRGKSKCNSKSNRNRKKGSLVHGAQSGITSSATRELQYKTIRGFSMNPERRPALGLERFETLLKALLVIDYHLG